jgi:hypothetical protein
MDKISISKIEPLVFSQLGFDECGCLGCPCNDSCCGYGADVDRESYKLIFSHRNQIEKIIGIKLEQCFSGKWSNDREFLGGNSIRAKKLRRGKCAFHLPKGKGCALYQLAWGGKAEMRIIPSICRLYPVSWNNGRIYLCRKIEIDCNCIDSKNRSKMSVFEHHKKAVEDIFKIKD